MYMTSSSNYRWETGNGLDQAGFVFVLKELQHTTCLDTSTNQEYTKNMKKSRHSATHWKQGVTVYLFFLKCFPFFSFFNIFFQFLMLQLCVQSQKISPLRPTTKKTKQKNKKQKKATIQFHLSNTW